MAKWGSRMVTQPEQADLQLEELRDLVERAETALVGITKAIGEIKEVTRELGKTTDRLASVKRMPNNTRG